jgi:cytochrome c
MKGETPMFRHTVLAACFLLVVGCGGGNQTETDTASKPVASAKPAAGSNKGIGPAVAATGKEVFETKCSACHKWEERYVGPALMGVTKRRTPEWIMNMILNPDEMIKNDEQAKALFVQYLTPMTFQNVTESEVEAILTYFRSMDAPDSGASQ